jgi:hypothetical protein
MVNFLNKSRPVVNSGNGVQLNASIFIEPVFVSLATTLAEQK